MAQRKYCDQWRQGVCEATALLWGGESVSFIAKSREYIVVGKATHSPASERLGELSDVGGVKNERHCE